MYVVIDTNGANQIVIAVPGDMAPQSLPTLAAMFEKNAVFIYKGYRDAKIVEPKMSIQLGDAYKLEGEDLPIIFNLPESGTVIGPDFHLATPEVFVSHAKIIKEKSDQIIRLQAEKQVLEGLLNDARAALEASSGKPEDEEQ